MALIKCDECAAEVSSKAAACPKCGNPLLVQPAAKTQPPKVSNERKGGAFKVLTVAGIVIAAIFYFAPKDGSISSGSDLPAQSAADATSAVAAAAVPAPEPEPAAQAAPEPPILPRPTIDISANQLFAEYKGNEVLADTKYKGRRLAVNGIVTEIGKDFSGDPYVNLATGQMYENVRGNFQKSAISRLSELHRGDSVTLTCDGAGMIVGSPMLDCTK
ncbi:OB-fold protein [Paraburkholderia fungorum]|uniref:OB-fold protein n=1 Tax=Paraburkholderia fungorum TaxID=134537 RepID=UPI000D4CC667|nr:hypothetical protein [Paraburkholderia fungorum]PRZ56138.1 putative nucleic acid binding protein [Paraburkholderia fungorum]